MLTTEIEGKVAGGRRGSTSRGRAYRGFLSKIESSNDSVSWLRALDVGLVRSSTRTHRDFAAIRGHGGHLPAGWRPVGGPDLPWGSAAPAPRGRVRRVFGQRYAPPAFAIAIYDTPC